MPVGDVVVCVVVLLEAAEVLLVALVVVGVNVDVVEVAVVAVACWVGEAALLLDVVMLVATAPAAVRVAVDTVKAEQWRSRPYASKATFSVSVGVPVKRWHAPFDPLNVK